MLEDKLYTALTGSTLVTGYTALRIYPVSLPQEVAYPCMVYQRLSGGQISGLQGYYNLENPLIQIDVLSTSYLTSKTIADNVHTVLDGTTTFHSRLITDTDFYEEDAQRSLWGVSMDFDCWNRQ